MANPHCRIRAITIAADKVRSPRITRWFVVGARIEKHLFEIKEFDPTRDVARFELVSVSGG